MGRAPLSHDTASDTVRMLYTQDAPVYLETGADKVETLGRVLDLAHFEAHVERVYQRSQKPRSAFHIAIKPNLMTAAKREEDSPVYTDPLLVESLLARLRAGGFVNLAVVESRNVYDYAYEGRAVPAVAAMAGYTAQGYTIEDLTAQQEPYDYGGVLGRHTVGRAWRDADFRISFAKNKTHWQCYYTGCMKNIYGCLPAWDKMKHYHGHHREFYECCILMLEAFPVHFALLDAWVSGDGLSGHVRDAHPNHTRMIFASPSVLALDWVMGEKMGLDPQQNAVVREAITRWGMPSIQQHGDLTPWHPWSNVSPLVIGALDGIEEVYGLSRFLSRAFASEQDPRFPPVRRWQWLFGPLQRLAGSVERCLSR